MSYPVNYVQGHFSLAAPYGFDGQNEFSKAWLSDNFPRMIAVTFQHPNAVLRRLLRRELGQRRALRRRDHAGADSGGREALPHHPRAVRAHPVRRIDGRLGSRGAADLPSRLLRRARAPTVPTRSRSPTSKASTSTRTRTRSTRSTAGARFRRRTAGASNGQLVMTSRTAQSLRAGQRHARADRASRSTSGRRSSDRSARTATSSRSSTSGPARSISEVAKYWKEHYDLRYHLEKNWPTLGPKLVDKLYFYTGDVDTYYLNNSTKRARAVDEDDREPALRGLLHVRRQQAALLERAGHARRAAQGDGAAHQRKKPEGATTPWWTY